MNDDFQRLAGATLDQVQVDWRNAIVRISFLATPQPCAVRAMDFRSVVVPRSTGAAARVASATTRDGALEIALESGERLRVEAASFAFDALSG